MSHAARSTRSPRAAHLARTLTVVLQRAARTSSQVLLYGSTLLFAGIFTGSAGSVFRNSNVVPSIDEAIS